MISKTLRSRYKILEKLGSGGFGDTYLAQDLDLPFKPYCVVKHLSPKGARQEHLVTAKKLFNSEAEVLYRLGAHNQIPCLYAHFCEDDEFYLVQEFIDGHDLGKEIIPGQVKTEAETIELLQSILSILIFVHQQGVIHRDIKPQNIIRRKQDGKLVLIDFGAVKNISTEKVNSSFATSSTIAIGTRGYMAPEQLNGHPKLCSDIYATGIIGIQALTGLTPQLLLKHSNVVESTWHDKLHGCEKLKHILDRMVAYNFLRRYQSASFALEAIMNLQTAPREQPIMTLLTDNSTMPSAPLRTNIISDSDLLDAKEIETENKEIVDKKQLAFAIAGTVDEIDQTKLKAILALLQDISGDASMKIIRVESGSIKLILSGSDEGLEKIKELFESGELTEIMGETVEYVRFIDEILDKKIITTTTSQHQAITQESVQKLAINDAVNSTGIQQIAVGESKNVFVPDDQPSRLQSLLIQVQNQPLGSLQRYHALTLLFKELWKQPTFGILRRPLVSKYPNLPNGFFEDLFNDALQETCIAISLNIHKFDSRRPLLPLICTIVRNKFSNLYKKYYKYGVTRVPKSNGGNQDFTPYQVISLDGLDEFVQDNTMAESESIYDSLREFLIDDPEGLLKKYYIKDRPDITFQYIAIYLYVEGRDMQQLANELAISYNTLNAFFQKRLEKLESYFRNYLQD